MTMNLLVRLAGLEYVFLLAPQIMCHLNWAVFITKDSAQNSHLDVYHFSFHERKSVIITKYITVTHIQNQQFCYFSGFYPCFFSEVVILPKLAYIGINNLKSTICNILNTKS